MTEKRTSRVLVFLSIWILLSCNLLVAKVASGNEGFDVDAKYKGSLARLKTAACGKELKFDAAGRLISGSPPIHRSECDGLRIQSAAVDEGTLKITEQRVRLVYDCATLEYKEPATPAQQSERKDSEFKHGRLSIKIQLPSQADEATIAELREKIFVLSTSKPAAIPARSSSDSISPPEALYTPQPDYSKAAQKPISGTVILGVIVGTDGRLKDVHVLRPLDKDLDEQAMRVAKEWKFKPALKCGVPMAVSMQIEIS